MEQTKKILHIINGEFFAGAERVQDLLALNLPDEGYECFFIGLKQGDFESKRNSTSPFRLFEMKSKFDFGLSKRIVEFANDKDFCAVHTHTARSALIGKNVAKKLKLPFIHHVHSPTQRDTENPIRNIINAFVEDKLILPKTDHLIPVSLSLKGYLMEHKVPQEKITPVFNGVPIMLPKSEWAEPEDGTWVIGTVALFRPRKGLEILLQSIRELKDAGLNIKLKAVGTFESPEYEKQIHQLAKNLEVADLIEWVGFSSDVHSQLLKMHIFVLPSLFGEGLPMVVIEAMSMGVPVVSTDVEGIPDVLQNGECGEIVEPNDSKALTTGIKNYILNNKDPLAISKKALERQRERYSDKAMATGVAKVYNAILGSERFNEVEK